MTEQIRDEQKQADDGLAAVVRKLREDVDELLKRDERHSENWLRACARFMDATTDGRM